MGLSTERRAGSTPRALDGEISQEAWLVRIRCDSSAAIAISTRTGVGRTRHIETRWLWIQDATREKKVSIPKVGSAENVADIGTKALDPKQHGALVQLLPLRRPSSPQLLAAIAAVMAAGTAGQAPEEQRSTCGIQAANTDDADGTGIVSVMIVLLAGVMLGLGVIPTARWLAGTWAATWRSLLRKCVDKETQTDEVTLSSVACQAPVTYTVLRGCAKPRFQVLPEPLHG